MGSELFIVDVDVFGVLVPGLKEAGTWWLVFSLVFISAKDTHANVSNTLGPLKSS